MLRFKGFTDGQNAGAQFVAAFFALHLQFQIDVLKQRHEGLSTPCDRSNGDFQIINRRNPLQIRPTCRRVPCRSEIPTHGARAVAKLGHEDVRKPVSAPGLTVPRVTALADLRADGRVLEDLWRLDQLLNLGAVHRKLGMKHLSLKQRVGVFVLDIAVRDIGLE
jgi:hypothetical protein